MPMVDCYTVMPGFPPITITLFIKLTLYREDGELRALDGKFWQAIKKS